MLDTVTEAQWREFDANGVVSLGVALSPTELRALSDRLDAIMLGDVGDPFERMLCTIICSRASAATGYPPARRPSHWPPF